MDTAKEFFVYIKHGPCTGFLLGPYPSKEVADGNVKRGRELASVRDPFAIFMDMGTCAAPVGKVPVTIFGN
jgi:hypothetical protein